MPHVKCRGLFFFCAGYYDSVIRIQKNWGLAHNMGYCIIKRPTDRDKNDARVEKTILAEARSVSLCIWEDKM